MAENLPIQLDPLLHLGTSKNEKIEPQEEAKSSGIVVEKSYLSTLKETASFLFTLSFFEEICVAGIFGWLPSFWGDNLIPIGRDILFIPIYITAVWFCFVFLVMTTHLLGLKNPLEKAFLKAYKLRKLMNKAIIFFWLIAVISYQSAAGNKYSFIENHLIRIGGFAVLLILYFALNMHIFLKKPTRKFAFFTVEVV